MRHAALLLLAGLAACAAPRSGQPAGREPSGPAAVVSSRGDVALLAVAVQSGVDGPVLAGRVRLRWPVLPAEATVRVVTRDGGGSVLADLVVPVRPAACTFRHKGGRPASFRVALPAAGERDGAGTIQASLPADPERLEP